MNRPTELDATGELLKRRTFEKANSDRNGGTSELARETLIEGVQLPNATVAWS
jgi:hypothetical protein